MRRGGAEARLRRLRLEARPVRGSQRGRGEDGNPTALGPTPVHAPAPRSCGRSGIRGRPPSSRSSPRCWPGCCSASCSAWRPRAESSTLHRAGGHALATVAQAQHAAAAAVTAVAGGEAATATATDSASTRSPARGGFAVGRAAGAGSGFIVLAAGTRAPVRGGFAGRSLGAGHVPADDPAARDSRGRLIAGPRGPQLGAERRGGAGRDEGAPGPSSALVQASSVRRYADTAASPPSSTSPAQAYPRRNASSSPKAAPGMTKAPLKSNSPWQKSTEGRSCS